MSELLNQFQPYARREELDALREELQALYQEVSSIEPILQQFQSASTEKEKLNVAMAFLVNAHSVDGSERARVAALKIVEKYLTDGAPQENETLPPPADRLEAPEGIRPA